MDIRLLVTQIADALGPDISPARVEAVAEAVLGVTNGYTNPHPPVYRAPDSGERVIITAFGIDQPGILAGLTGAVSEVGVNILDVSQKILQGYFTLIMMADVGNMRGSLHDLQSHLKKVGQHLNVQVLVQHEDLFNAMHRP